MAGVAALQAASAQDLPSAPHLTLIERGSRLLTENQVQSQLALTDVQKTKVDHVMAWLGVRVTNLMQQPRPDEEAVETTDKMASSQLLQILTPVQRQKLTKLTLQRAGYSALVAPELIVQLKLTSDQVMKIRAVLDDAEEPLLKMEGFAAQAVATEPKRATEIERSYEPERAKLRKKRIEAESKALDILTPEQRKSWNESIGR